MVSIGSLVALEDLDDGVVERYVVVPADESDPAHGRLSEESPVGRAVIGHRRGEVVAVQAPHRIRHLRIGQLRPPAASANTRTANRRPPGCAARGARRSSAGKEARQ